MRIGIDVRTAQVNAALRGLARYALNVIEGLRRHAPEHELVLLAMPSRPLPESFARLAVAAGARPVWVDVPPRSESLPPALANVPRLWRVLDPRRDRAEVRALAAIARRERLDVLHLPSVFDAELFAHVPPGNGTAVVKTVHDLIPLIFAREVFGPGAMRDERHYRRQGAVLGDADALIAVSASAREDAIRLLGVPADRIHVVPNVVDEVPTPGEDAIAAALARHDVRRPYFLCCSGGGLNKNRERLLEAFARVHADAPAGVRHQLVLAGPDDFRDVAGLKALAFDRGLGRDDVRFTGFVSDDDLAALFAAATALVSPSLYEGFGIPTVQAMRAGIPVLASDRSSHPEVVGDAGVLVDPTSVQAIADGMRRLATDAALRETLVRRGRERAARYAMEPQTRALLAVYEQARARR
ncbi:MAG TPA: glycosyltransferase family 1 protein [Gemmatimonadaceae bacterium]|nr:glycosyltransferase family 1 protein [Gemmatimonadaceae bacterium]